jgi:hypothetical protein
VRGRGYGSLLQEAMLAWAAAARWEVISLWLERIRGERQAGGVG